jgi:hypothetical protein
MRVRDHVVLSTAAALAARPWVGRSVLAPWLASILVDLDHYVWFAFHERTVNPLAATRYFNGAHPADHAATRALHSSLAVSCSLLLGVYRRGALKAALGLAAHVALDAGHEARVRTARDAALRRDGFTCRSCGAQGGQVETHLLRQPFLLPSYRPDDFVSLCPSCHEEAHGWTPPRATTPSAEVVA